MIPVLINQLSAHLEAIFPKAGYIRVVIPCSEILTFERFKAALVYLKDKLPDDAQFCGSVLQASVDAIEIRFLTSTVPTNEFKTINYDGSSQECSTSKPVNPMLSP